MRLIDAEKLPRQKQLEAMGNGQYIEVEIVRGVDIDNAPTIEAELVVRCKECKHCDTGINEDGNKFWKCLGRHYGGVNPYDFCSYGESEYKEVWVVHEEDIDNAPTIEAEEVRHGKWIVEKVPYEKQLTKFTCSECGDNFETVSEVAKKFRYCRSCGAKMEVE